MTAIPLADLAQTLAATRDRLESQAGRSRMATEISNLIGRISARLTRPPRIVILGEFNSGKSTLANALIGAEVLPTSIHANTRVPILIHHSPAPTLSFEGTDRRTRPLTLTTLRELRNGEARLLRVGLPVPRLRSFEVIDTPGLATGAGSKPDELVVEACRRSHIAIWCTVATQAWKASEQGVWDSLPGRLRGRGLLAVTQADGIHGDRDRGRLAARLALEAAPQFRSLAMISAAEADAVRRMPDAPDYAERWECCGGRALEDALQAAVDVELTSRRRSAERLLRRAADRLAEAIAAARAEPAPGLAA